MKMSESIVELSKALSKFQSEVKQPIKDGTNPHFRSQFVTLDGVVAAITDTAPKYGLSFLQFPLNEDDKVGVKTLVLHDSGEFIEGDPIYTKPMKNDPQALGAVVTYLRRYSLSAIFGITSETDSDAEGAMDRGNQATFNNNAPQQQYAPRQQYNKAPQQQAPQANTNLISESQVKLIKMLINNVVKATGTDASMVVELIKGKLKIGEEVRTNELTKGQASAFINELKEMEQGE